MNVRTLPLAFPVTSITFANVAPNLPSIPGEPIAKKKELLHFDDVERIEQGKAPGWAIVVRTYFLENGILKGSLGRFVARAKEGKPTVKGHQAVIGRGIPPEVSKIRFRIKFA
jgi:hypothetical protein